MTDLLSVLQKFDPNIKLLTPQEQNYSSCIKEKIITWIIGSKEFRNFYLQNRTFLIKLTLHDDCEKNKYIDKETKKRRRELLKKYIESDNSNE